MSSARHLETDGQTERVNQCLEGFLRCFVSSCQKKCVQWIPLAEFWYNTIVHSTLGKTPFEVLYGQAPRHFGVNVVKACAIPDLQQWLQDRNHMLDLLRYHLERQKQRMKSQADKQRILFTSSYHHMCRNLLLCKAIGSWFSVLEKVGKVAYKLKLPETSQIHPLIHVSQLKKAVGAQVEVFKEIPVEGESSPVPEQVLEKRWVKKGSTKQCQALPRWSGLPDSLATWENLEEMKRKFPDAPAWGQAGFKGGGNVMDSTVNTPSGKQRRKLRRVGRRPVQIAGPEWTN